MSKRVMLEGYGMGVFNDVSVLSIADACQEIEYRQKTCPEMLHKATASLSHVGKIVISSEEKRHYLRKIRHSLLSMNNEIPIRNINE